MRADSNNEKEIKPGISTGWAEFGKNSDILSSTLPLSLKKMVCNQCVLPVMAYRVEAWGFTKHIGRKLKWAKRAMESVLEVTLRDMKTAAWIREQTRLEDIVVQIKRKEWTWTGTLCA